MIMKPGPAAPAHFAATLSLFRKPVFRFFDTLSPLPGIFHQRQRTVRVNTEPRQCKIESDRINPVYHAKRSGNFKARPMICARASGQIKLPGYPVHMNINRNEKLRRSDNIPPSGINSIVSHHPSKKQMHAL